jgi:hypothetical protein
MPGMTTSAEARGRNPRAVPKIMISVAAVVFMVVLQVRQAKQFIVP